MSAPTNSLGLTRQDYVGGKSTLCTGCGHDSVTQALITALYQSEIPPYQIAKLSGIGCSSKTPAYFLSQSHGFNSIHGRMAPLATGVSVARSNLSLVGISGDGDTASIGLGGFAHLIRRNVPVLYVIENNGVYGLTKGQFSATADLGSTQKAGANNPFQGIDLCRMAIDLGCSFVARSFSGDTKQLVALLSAGLKHPGTAVIDVISPCITFANHEGSTKSYNNVKSHLWPLHELGWISSHEEVKVDYPEGGVARLPLPDGSTLTLRKLKSEDYDIASAGEALKFLHEAQTGGTFVTGLLHYRSSETNFGQKLNLPQTPLADMDHTQLRPSREKFQKIMQDFK